jgi:hypothetical protein
MTLTAGSASSLRIPTTDIACGGEGGGEKANTRIDNAQHIE